MQLSKSLKLAFGFFLLIGGTSVFAGEDVDAGATAWMLTSTGLVLLMIPGLAMFYGGLVRTKNVLGTMMHSFVALAVVGVLWPVCGYALTFGENVWGGFRRMESGLFFADGYR